MGALCRRPSGAEEGEAACRGRRGGGSASPTSTETQNLSNCCSGSAKIPLVSPIRRRRHASLVALAVGALVVGVACRARPVDPAVPAPDPETRVDAGEGNRPFRAGTAADREELRALVARLGTVRAEELLGIDGLGTQILARGEAAIPPLLDAAASPDPRVRGPAAYLLGVLKDRRTLPTLATLAESDPVASVRYEAAAALLSMLDPRGFAPLVAGLSDPDARLRHTCIDVLADAARERWGYEADGPPPERAAAIRRWEAWLEQRAVAPEPEPERDPKGDPPRKNGGR